MFETYLLFHLYILFYNFFCLLLFLLSRCRAFDCSIQTNHWANAELFSQFHPHYPPKWHQCHVFVMENAFVGIILIRGFYVNYTQKQVINENLGFIMKITKQYLPDGYSKNHIFISQFYLMENTYVGITLIRGFYVNYTQRQVINENLVLIIKITKYYLPDSYSKNHIFISQFYLFRTRFSAFWFKLITWGILHKEQD